MRIAKDVHQLWLSDKTEAKQHRKQILPADRLVRQFRFAACQWWSGLNAYELQVREKSHNPSDKRQIVIILQGRQQCVHWLQHLVQSLKQVKQMHQVDTRQQRSKRKKRNCGN